MNVIRRALAGELLSSSSSSSATKSSLLTRLHPQNNQTFPLQEPSRLYSTATTTSPSRSRKQPARTNTTTVSNTQEENPPKPPRNWAEAARQAAVVPPEKAESQKGLNGKEPRKELQKGLNGEEPRKEVPRPSVIPWQKKVANTVNLIGRIQIPVQFGAAPDGKYWAGTILSQGDVGAFGDSPFWIPIIFEGDLAHIAACHLKATDHVHIAGVLSSDPPPFTMKEGQANVQVMVQNINFVQESSQAKETFTSDNPDESDSIETSSSVVETKPDVETASDPWRDLLQNPQNWLDNRDRKLNGSLNPKFPDFKHKSNGTPLWINKVTPKWALAGLNESKVDVRPPNATPKEEIKGNPMPPSPTPKKETKGDDSWNELVENPNRWWDNRSGKINPKAPDFVHKDTRAALWLNRCPPSLMSSLPPPKE